LGAALSISCIIDNYSGLEKSSSLKYMVISAEASDISTVDQKKLSHYAEYDSSSSGLSSIILIILV
jgi:hypothetical protein